MADLLVRLCKEEIVDVDEPVSPLLAIEADMALMDDEAMNESDRPGQPSGYSCPDCNGVLWEIKDGELIRYRCRVGHAWSAESLLGEQSSSWTARCGWRCAAWRRRPRWRRTLADRAQERRSPRHRDPVQPAGRGRERAASLIRTMLEAHLGLPDQDVRS